MRRKFLCFTMALAVLASVVLARTDVFALSPTSVGRSEASIKVYASQKGFLKGRNWSVGKDANGFANADAVMDAEAILDMYRYVAGVSDVGFDANNTWKAQCASKGLSALGHLTHDFGGVRPGGLSDAEWEAAQIGVMRSNINKGNRNFYSVFSAMVADKDSHNASDVGHRRWMLSPSLRASGAGMFGDFSALYVVDLVKGPTQSVVSWPAAETPLELWEDGTPWSVSLPCDPTGNETVEVRRLSDGRTWRFGGGSHDGEFWIDAQNLGDQGAIIWRPSGLRVGAGDTFDVVVRGTGVGDISWRTHFFKGDFSGAWDGDNASSGGSGWKPAEGYIVDINGNKPVWRLYNKRSGEHLFTMDTNEYSTLGHMNYPA